MAGLLRLAREGGPRVRRGALLPARPARAFQLPGREAAELLGGAAHGPDEGRYQGRRGSLRVVNAIPAGERSPAAAPVAGDFCSGRRGEPVFGCRLRVATLKPRWLLDRRAVGAGGMVLRRFARIGAKRTRFTVWHSEMPLVCRCNAVWLFIAVQTAHNKLKTSSFLRKKREPKRPKKCRDAFRNFFLKKTDEHEIRCRCFERAAKDSGQLSELWSLPPLIIHLI